MGFESTSGRTIHTPTGSTGACSASSGLRRHSASSAASSQRSSSRYSNRFTESPAMLRTLRIGELHQFNHPVDHHRGAVIDDVVLGFRQTGDPPKAPVTA